MLDQIVATALRVAGGAMPLDLLAEDEAEAAALRELLKRRRGAKPITVRVAEPGELTPNIHWR